jgi:hypothetical protein
MESVVENMNIKFKLLFPVVAFSVLLVFPIGVSFASPLDLIYDAPGSLWAKADASVNSSDANHVQFEALQGVRFDHLTWLTWYVSMNWWEQIGISKTNYWAYGVKNDTFIPHLTFGLEEENYVFSTQPAPINALVGYASCNFDWNLKPHKDYKW